MAMGIHCSQQWEVRGKYAVHSAEIAREELEYVREPDPNHACLQLARRALGLDFVAFDYSYCHDGELIVWEANTLPGLTIARPTPTRFFISAVVDRAFALILALYCRRSGLEVPERVAEMLAISAAEWLDAALESGRDPGRDGITRERRTGWRHSARAFGADGDR